MDTNDIVHLLAGKIALEGIKNFPREISIGILCRGIGVNFPDENTDRGAIKIYQTIEAAAGLKPLSPKEGAVLVAILMTNIVDRVLAAAAAEPNKGDTDVITKK